MHYLPLRFKNKTIEGEFLQMTGVIVRRFYIITIFILFIISLYSVIFGYTNPATSDFPRIYAVTVLCITGVVLLIHLKIDIKIIAPFIAFGVGMGIIIVNFVAAKQAFEPLPDVLKTAFTGVYYAGFMVGMFHMLLEHLFLQLHVKFLYVVIHVALRWTLVPQDDPVTYLNSTFIDVANLVIMYLYERYNRSLFKSFYDKRDENAKFRTLLTEHFPQNIVILDKKLDKMFFANKSFTEHFKVETWKEVKPVLSNLKVILNTLNQSHSSTGTERSFQHLIGPNLIDYLTQYKNNTTQEGQISSFNVEFGDTDENKTTYECKILPLEWDRTQAFTIMLSDLTQQETILALKIADENKDRLLATVSHELRTPINGMLGITSIIEQEYQDPKLLSYVQSGRICAKMLLNLVNSILDLAQVRHNCIRLNTFSFKIQDMLKEVESIFRPQCAGKNIEFMTLVEKGVPQNITSDQSRLIQIIINLLSNALKFTIKGRILLRVALGAEKNEIKFSIEDTGTGIKEEDKPKLFKAFGKLEQTNPRLNSQGVGLGLTISNTLVKLLHPKKEDNKIEFESVYGEGTTFMFTISGKLRKRVEYKKEDQKPLKDSEEKSSYGYTDLMAEHNSDEKGNAKNRLKWLSSQHQFPQLIKNPKQKEPELDPAELGNILSTLNEERGLLDDRVDSLKMSPDPSPALTVLVVDDNPLNLLIASKLLENQGFSVITALNGQDAIRKVREQDKTNFFKAILMDCEMPIMNGFEATQALRLMIDQGEIPHVPIYAVTANTSQSDKDKCIQAGMVKCLSKPLRPQEVQILFEKISN